ncbi:GumC family protein [Sphingomonas jeddahensis]|uniref:Tyrosine-protein kinase ptk n=1 Tax=Sphingomonas jeddahensis TaxID=1915074 RepID=A0A1V2ETW3_9SPHN|nr:Wzz/FepE/Etk N-terminal domain-containing protein [Sphingomonas jeddahensis]ONF95748.1 Tyrosine-protein kinase ptk [Sphingomonas jeddahensis]
MEGKLRAPEPDARMGDVVARVSDALRRRWMLFIGIVSAVTLIGVLAVASMPPHYTAAARIRLDPSRSPLAGNAQAQRAELTPEAIDTEVMALRSPELAQAITAAHNLRADPEFAPANGTAASGHAVTAALLSHLTVDREAMAYVLQLRFTSADPLKAAALANAFAEGYIDRRMTNRVGTAERQSAWFRQRLDELGREVMEAEASAADYRARAGIVHSSAGPGAGTISDQQVAPLASSLASAESDAAAARSNLAAARAQVARGGMDAVSEVLGSVVIADLRRQRAEVLRARGEIDARYGERHPESIRVANQLASLDGQIDAEAQRVIGSLQASAAAAEARAGSLRASLDMLEHQREHSTRDAVIAAGLEREAAAKRALYERTSQMSLESMQAARLPIAQAEVIERAAPPVRPSAPNKPLLYALVLIVAMAAGMGTVAVIELSGGGLRSIKEIEDRLGVPVLAVVPRVRSGQNPADVMLERPASMFAESLRIARAAILGAREEHVPRVIAITSALPAEGKTTVALAFARTLAIGGTPTLIVECDIRRAVLRELVRSGSSGPGLIEVLRGEADAGEAIRPGDVTNLDQLLVRSPFFKADDPFGEGRMERLIAGLRDRYGHIVLDLPPLIGLADGRPLAALADATAVVIKWNATPAPAAASALSWLRTDGSNPVGVILTQVDPAAPAVGGLYHHSKLYSDYYRAA